MSQIEKGSLYIVATPIGNTDDITERARQVLAAVDAIAAEDTRDSRRLLQHLGIDTPLFALHEHNETQQAEAVIRRLQEGESIALVSDAGTPLISDPGYPLVHQARLAGVRVVPVPGASSVLAALSCSGLPTDRFVFEGFLPAKAGVRQKRLSELASDSRTHIFFEAPHRISDCLQDLQTVFGADRQAVLARELTKTYETFLAGTVSELLAQVQADSNQQRGEMVLVLAGNTRATGMDAAAEKIFFTLLEELPLKQASQLAARITGIGKNVFYQAGLDKAGR
jgi:16S rRNA (cytidine1402-2'-O)-methyltransferase